MNYQVNLIGNHSRVSKDHLTVVAVFFGSEVVLHTYKDDVLVVCNLYRNNARILVLCEYLSMCNWCKPTVRFRFPNFNCLFSILTNQLHDLLYVNVPYILITTAWTLQLYLYSPKGFISCILVLRKLFFIYFTEWHIFNKCRFPFQ